MQHAEDASPEDLVLARSNWEKANRELDVALGVLRDHRAPGECSEPFCSGSKFAYGLDSCDLSWARGLLQVALTRILEMEQAGLQERFIDSGVAAKVDAFLADPSVGVRVERR